MREARTRRAHILRERALEPRYMVRRLLQAREPRARRVLRGAGRASWHIACAQLLRTTRTHQPKRRREENGEDALVLEARKQRALQRLEQPRAQTRRRRPLQEAEPVRRAVVQRDEQLLDVPRVRVARPPARHGRGREDVGEQAEEVEVEGGAEGALCEDGA